MIRFPSLTTVIRSAAIAVALGGATLVAMPAQAAPAPHFSFSFGFGTHTPHWGHSRYCLSDRQVRRLLQRYGYDHIRFTDRRGRVVSVHAERHHRDYRVVVDSCRGRIIEVQRLRHHHRR